MADAFEDAKKAAKKIKKAQKLSEYEQAVESMFESELVRTE